MTSDDDRYQRLHSAAHPRRANSSDTPQLARLFTAAFLDDPVLSWIARRGPGRAIGLERFFFWVSADERHPVRRSVDGGRRQRRHRLVAARCAGKPGRFLGAAAPDPAVLAVVRFSASVARLGDVRGHGQKPSSRTTLLSVVYCCCASASRDGLGSALLEATLARIDETDVPAYLENSNPKNTRLYERHGFERRKNIAPSGAPPLIAMWRSARPRSLAAQGSNSLSQ